MGSCLAIYLSRHGYRVDLYDAEARPMDRASRWNEGKIHLGYLYSADSSLQTARRLIPGGLRFAPLLSDLIDADVRDMATGSDDHFLVHRQSVVPPDDLEAYCRAVDDLIAEHPDARHSLAGAGPNRSRRLRSAELAEVTGSTDILAGLAIPERSVNTLQVADHLARALLAAPGVTFHPGIRISSARPEDTVNGRWIVESSVGGKERFDLVVNALWNGRLEIDTSAGLALPTEWSHRYRLALFIHTQSALAVPSAMVAVGPFGDIKNYNGRDFYLSWYPAGLVQTSSELLPEDPRPFPETKIAEVEAGVRHELGRLIRDVHHVFDTAESTTCDGGFVFAQATGLLSDPQATIHRRDRFGVARRGGYISIDTGKYSTAPFMAETLAREIAGL